MRPMATEDQKHENSWGSWALIVFLFAVGVWPVALFFLFFKLGKDKGGKSAAAARPNGEQSAAAQSSRRSTARRAGAAARNLTRAPAVKRSNARMMKLIGLAGLAVGLLYAAGPANMVFSGYAASFLWDFMKYLAIAVGGLSLFWGGVKMDASMRRYARYSAVMEDTQAIPVADLCRKLGWSEKRVEKDLERMIDRGYFGPQAYLDQSLGCFFRSAQADAEMRRQRDAASSAQEPPREAEEGYSGILRNIRRANDRIADPALSMKIDRLEDVAARIFRAVEADPKKRGRIDTFMNYYLPTTQKILDAYAEFDAAGVEGENLRQAKQRIEQTMDSIVAGFEHQLDELYKTDAMDVDSDIRVMETMLRRDTASVERDFGLGGSKRTEAAFGQACDEDLGGTAAQTLEE